MVLLDKSYMMVGPGILKRNVKYLCYISVLLVFFYFVILLRLQKHQRIPVTEVERTSTLTYVNDSILHEWYNAIKNNKTTRRRGILRNEITEQEASKNFPTNVFDRLTDYCKIQNISNLQELPNPKTTIFKLENGQTKFKIGDEIRVKIELKDGWGRRVLIGGDILRIWMSNPKLGANSTGYVIDHGNGSYTGILKALWKGKANIKASIAITKEHIGMFMNYVIQKGIWYFMFGYFEHPKSKQTVRTKCTTISSIESYKEVCNFTQNNFGMAWYCGRPKSRNFSCKDWTFYSASKENSIIKNELNLAFLRYHKHLYLPKPIAVDVTEGPLVLPKITCKQRKSHLSWFDKTPAGFFHMGKWYSLRCKITIFPQRSRYLKCLANKPLIFLGDSASRYWFVYLTQFLNLKFTVGRWDDIKDKAWQKYAYSERKDLNISLSWAPHELPMYGDKANVKNIRSVASRLNEIPAKSNAVVLLHWYLHTARLPPDAYREHVRNAKVAVVSLLQRAPDVKIFIKGPHAVMYPHNFEPHDFVRLMNDQIMFEEFSDIQDKVTYLNQWDMTVASENEHVHPPPAMNLIMVNELLSYVC